MLAHHLATISFPAKEQPWETMPVNSHQAMTEPLLWMTPMTTICSGAAATTVEGKCSNSRARSLP